MIIMGGLMKKKKHNCHCDETKNTTEEVVEKEVFPEGNSTDEENEEKTQSKKK